MEEDAGTMSTPNSTKSSSPKKSDRRQNDSSTSSSSSNSSSRSRSSSSSSSRSRSSSRSSSSSSSRSSSSSSSRSRSSSSSSSSNSPSNAPTPTPPPPRRQVRKSPRTVAKAEIPSPTAAPATVAKLRENIPSRPSNHGGGSSGGRRQSRSTAPSGMQSWVETRGMQLIPQARPLVTHCNFIDIVAGSATSGPQSVALLQLINDHEEYFVYSIPMPGHMDYMNCYDVRILYKYVCQGVLDWFGLKDMKDLALTGPGRLQSLSRAALDKVYILNPAFIYPNQAMDVNLMRKGEVEEDKYLSVVQIWHIEEWYDKAMAVHAVLAVNPTLRQQVYEYSHLLLPVGRRNNSGGGGPAVGIFGTLWDKFVDSPWWRMNVRLFLQLVQLATVMSSWVIVSTFMRMHTHPGSSAAATQQILGQQITQMLVHLGSAFVVRWTASLFSSMGFARDERQAEALTHDAKRSTLGALSLITGSKLSHGLLRFFKLSVRFLGSGVLSTGVFFLMQSPAVQGSAGYQFLITVFHQLLNQMLGTYQLPVHLAQAPKDQMWQSLGQWMLQTSDFTNVCHILDGLLGYIVQGGLSPGKLKLCHRLMQLVNAGRDMFDMVKLVQAIGVNYQTTVAVYQDCCTPRGRFVRESTIETSVRMLNSPSEWMQDATIEQRELLISGARLTGVELEEYSRVLQGTILEELHRLHSLTGMNFSVEDLLQANSHTVEGREQLNYFQRYHPDMYRLRKEYLAATVHAHGFETSVRQVRAMQLDIVGRMTTQMFQELDARLAAKENSSSSSSGWLWSSESRDSAKAASALAEGQELLMRYRTSIAEIFGRGIDWHDVRAWVAATQTVLQARHAVTRGQKTPASTTPSATNPPTTSSERQQLSAAGAAEQVQARLQGFGTTQLPARSALAQTVASEAIERLYRENQQLQGVVAELAAFKQAVEIQHAEDDESSRGPQDSSISTAAAAGVPSGRTGGGEEGATAAGGEGVGGQAIRPPVLQQQQQQSAPPKRTYTSSAAAAAALSKVYAKQVDILKDHVQLLKTSLTTVRDAWKQSNEMLDTMRTAPQTATRARADEMQTRFVDTQGQVEAKLQALQEQHLLDASEVSSLKACMTGSSPLMAFNTVQSFLSARLNEVYTEMFQTASKNMWQSLSAPGAVVEKAVDHLLEVTMATHAFDRLAQRLEIDGGADHVAVSAVLQKEAALMLDHLHRHHEHLTPSQYGALLLFGNRQVFAQDTLSTGASATAKGVLDSLSSAQRPGWKEVQQSFVRLMNRYVDQSSATAAGQVQIPSLLNKPIKIIRSVAAEGDTSIRGLWAYSVAGDMLEDAQAQTQLAPREFVKGMAKLWETKEFTKANLQDVFASTLQTTASKNAVFQEFVRSVYNSSHPTLTMREWTDIREQPAYKDYHAALSPGDRARLDQGAQAWQESFMSQRSLVCTPGEWQQARQNLEQHFGGGVQAAGEVLKRYKAVLQERERLASGGVGGMVGSLLSTATAPVSALADMLPFGGNSSNTTTGADVASKSSYHMMERMLAQTCEHFVQFMDTTEKNPYYQNDKAPLLIPAAVGQTPMLDYAQQAASVVLGHAQQAAGVVLDNAQQAASVVMDNVGSAVAAGGQQSLNLLYDTMRDGVKVAAKRNPKGVASTAAFAAGGMGLLMMMRRVIRRRAAARKRSQDERMKSWYDIANRGNVRPLGM